MEAGPLQLATERAVIFKDGYGLMVKSAHGIADQHGRVYTDSVPDAAVLGTFWATSEGHELLSMTADWVEQDDPDSTSCLSTLELLRANVGHTVSLELDKSELSGKLLQILEPPSVESVVGTAPVSPEATLPVALQSRADALARTLSATSEAQPLRGNEQLVLENEKGRHVLPVNQVKSLTGKDLQTRCRHPKRTKRLDFDLGSSAAGAAVNLHLIYFTPGLRWIPTYRVNTAHENKADLSLQGEILNEEEDLDGAAVDLVVGVPNFRFKGNVSPLSLEKMLRQALVQAAPNLMGNDNGLNNLSNAMFSQRAIERYQPVNDEGNGDAPLATAPDLASEKAQDMFVYNVKTLSLRKGARAAVSLWKSRVPRRDLYTLDVSVHRNPHSAIYSYGGASMDSSSGSSPLHLSVDRIWHQIELSNESNVPWTTGAALLMQNELPLAQELLTYTSPGGKVLVPETVAVDMRSSEQEQEVERTPDAKKVDGVTYAHVHKKGTVTITSHKHEKALVRVTLSTGGKVDHADHDGKIRYDDVHAADWAGGPITSLNNHSDVDWELTLEPNQTVTLGYEVSLFE
jgi:hypothetical protein